MSGNGGDVQEPRVATNLPFKMHTRTTSSAMRDPFFGARSLKRVYRMYVVPVRTLLAPSFGQFRSHEELKAAGVLVEYHNTMEGAVLFCSHTWGGNVRSREIITVRANHIFSLSTHRVAASERSHPIAKCSESSQSSCSRSWHHGRSITSTTFTRSCRSGPRCSPGPWRLHRGGGQGQVGAGAARPHLRPQASRARRQ